MTDGHNPLIIGVMDDFFSSLKNLGSRALSGLKDFAADNKHLLYPLVQAMLTRIHPAAASAFDLAKTHFGGQLRSEDPYAVDWKYMRYLFGRGPPHPLARMENHYMYQMTSVR